MAEEVVNAAASGEIVGQQYRLKGIIGKIPGRCALRGTGEPVYRVLVCIHAGRVQYRIDNSEPVSLPKEGLSILGPRLHRVHSSRIGNICVNAGIGQSSSLRNRFALNRPEIRQRIAARVVAVSIFPDVRTESEYGMRPEDLGKCRRNVEGLDLGVLIGIAHILAKLVEHVQIVVGVRRLKPGAAIVQVQLNGIRLVDLVIHPIEGIQLVSLGMKNRELRGVKEPARVESIDFDEIPPVFSAVAQVDLTGSRSEASVGGRQIDRGLGETLS